MPGKNLFRLAIGILGLAGQLFSQAPQTVAVRAGQMFDPKSGQLLANQVILIQRDRIAAVGPAANVSIPAGAKMIDLSRATVLPGLIDGHVHLTDAAGGLQHQMLVAMHSATESLRAGFTTQVCMGSHGGGYADVELKKAIETGLVHGPRLITAGPVIEITSPASAVFPLEFKPFEPSLIANGLGDAAGSAGTGSLRIRPRQDHGHRPLFLQAGRGDGERSVAQPGGAARGGG